MSTITHATVRAAGLPDVEHIISEYEEAAKKLPAAEAANILPRSSEEVRSAVENGLFFIVEDAAGNFMAGAGVFALTDPDIKELGMCYVKKEWQGFKLQELLILIRVCAATLGEVPDEKTNKGYAILIAAVKPTNLASIKSTENVGFKSLPTPPAAALVPCASCRTRPISGLGRVCCCDYYHLPPVQRAAAIERALQVGNWCPPLKKDNSQLIVALSTRHLQHPESRHALEDIVNNLRYEIP